MGCRSEYMEATEREKESVLVCQLLTYVLMALKLKIPQEVSSAAMAPYGNLELLDEHTAMLCDICGKMDKKTSEKVIYNAHLPASRQLAEWWERHQEADRQRIAVEKKADKKATLIKSAKAKLTAAELKALQEE